LMGQLKLTERMGNLTSQGFNPKYLNSKGQYSPYIPNRILAIVIGVDKYSDTSILQLDCAENDANAIAKLLEEKFNFEVRLLLSKSATRNEILQKFDEILLEFPLNYFLFYFAGHGTTHNNTICICPSDFKRSDSSNGITITELMNYTINIHPKHSLFLLDCCLGNILMINERMILNENSVELLAGVTQMEKGLHGEFTKSIIDTLSNITNDSLSVSHLLSLISHHSVIPPIYRRISGNSNEFVFERQKKRNISKFLSQNRESKDIEENNYNGVYLDNNFQGKLSVDLPFHPENVQMNINEKCQESPHM